MLSSSLEKMQRINNVTGSYVSSTQRQQTPSLSYPDDSYVFSTKKTESEPKLGFCAKLIHNIASKFLNKSKEEKVSVQIPTITVEYSKDKDNILKRMATSRYIDYDNGKILDELNPITLEYRALPTGKKLLEVSNFEFPKGTIMATTSLDECIASGKFLMCAGLAIVDKEKNQQTLMHCFPGNASDDVDKLLKHIIDNSSDKLDITIISGAYDSCEETISYLADSLKNLTPNNKIKFANFSEDLRLFNRAIVLENGKLTCCTNDELEDNTAKTTNPMDRISYIEAPYNMKR